MTSQLRKDAQTFLDGHEFLYHRQHGSKPVYKDQYRVQVERLLQRIPPKELVRRLKIYFTNPPFSLQGGARDLQRFIKNVDLLAAPAEESTLAKLARMEQAAIGNAPRKEIE